MSLRVIEGAQDNSFPFISGWFSQELRWEGVAHICRHWEGEKAGTQAGDFVSEGALSKLETGELVFVWEKVGFDGRICIPPQYFKICHLILHQQGRKPF